MDKEIEKKLKDLKDTLGNFLNENAGKLNDMVNDRLEEANQDKFLIKAERKDSGRVEIHLEGDKLAILCGLAGLEKQILKELKPSKEFWEQIKDAMDVEDAK